MRAHGSPSLRNSSGWISMRPARQSAITFFKRPLHEATASCKGLLKKVIADWRAGRMLIQPLEFLNEGDPWARMQQSADQVQFDVRGLQTMRSPHFINGWLPWLILVAGWLMLTA